MTVLLAIRSVGLQIQMSRHIRVHDGNSAFTSLDGVWRGRGDGQNAVRRQRRTNSVLVVFCWKRVLANKRALNLFGKIKEKCVLETSHRIVISLSYRAVPVGAFLMLSFDDNHVVNRLYRDLRWLKVVHVDTRLESIFAKVQVLLVGHVAESLAGNLPWATVSGRQVVVAETRNDHF